MNDETATNTFMDELGNHVDVMDALGSEFMKRTTLLDEAMVEMSAGRSEANVIDALYNWTIALCSLRGVGAKVANSAIDILDEYNRVPTHAELQADALECLLNAGLEAHVNLEEAS